MDNVMWADSPKAETPCNEKVGAGDTVRHTPGPWYQESAEVFAGSIHIAAVARGRQVLLMTALLPKLDSLLTEAAAARVSAPGLLEIIEWCEFNLEENAAACMPPLDIRPDAVKDAVAASVAAAKTGNAAAYASARADEAVARAAA